MSTQYEERDAAALDKAGGYYTRHVMAMTREGLHDKSDIAAELGYRDMLLDSLAGKVIEQLPPSEDVAHRDRVIGALKAKIARVVSAHEGLRLACDEISKALDSLTDLEGGDRE